MKKIVGIVAAVAMAASVFAVDFSAGVRLEGSLLNYSNKTFSALKEQHVNEFYHVPISFAISGDQAGGALKLSDKGDDNKVVITDAWNIWIKPIDILKINIGRWSTNLNQEHIGWCNTDSGIEKDGYALSINSGAFGLDVFFASGNGNYWFSKADGADAAIAELYTKVQYAADFGTINAFLNAANNFKDYRFGAGYNFGSLLPVGLWINAIGIYAGNDFQRIRAEADVSTNFGSIGWELFVAGGYDVKASAPSFNNTFTGVEGWHVGGSYGRGEPAAFCGIYTKFSIPVDAFGVYVEIKDGDLLAKDFNMNVKPGFTYNLGACAINLGVSIDVKKDFGFDVPVEFKVSF